MSQHSREGILENWPEDSDGWEKLENLKVTVQNDVMNRKFLKNFVMGAKIDTKVVIDLSMFEIGGWNRKLLEEGIEENGSQLLSIKIPSGDLLLTIQHLERQ